MDERNTVTPDVGAYSGLQIVGSDPSTIGGVIRLLSTYRGPEILGLVGAGIIGYLVAPATSVVIKIVGVVAILVVVVIGMLITGRRGTQNAPAQARTGETQADP